MTKIGIIHLGLGNAGSVKNMVEYLGYSCKLIETYRDLEEIDKLILPGVGSFDAGVKKLKERKLFEALKEFILHKKKPILGICLGMQLLTCCSEEGTEEGLNVIPAKTVKFNFKSKNLPLPHMGWNYIDIVKKEKLFKGFDKKARFYFVHSYHVLVKDRNIISSLTCYGYNFVSSFEYENIFGVQFHPEKSHKFGLKLIKNFLEV